MKRHAIWIITAILLYCAWTVSPVSAHAELLRSIPEANAILSEAPEKVELLFSESLESKLSTIKVYDSNGQIVDKGDAGIDPTNSGRMTVSLPTLPDGIYTVSWQALSQTDGHVTGGSFPFAVGNIDASNLPSEQATNSNPPISALITKWLLLASLALLGGQFPSRFFIWNPAFDSNDKEPGLFNRLSRSWDDLYKIGLIGTLLAIGLGVLAQAGQTAGHELAAPWAKEVGQVLTETRLGVIWLIRLALALIGIWLVRSHPVFWKHLSRFLVGLALLFTVSLTSHAATELHPLLPVLSDWLHLTGMAFWFGGLGHLIIGLATLQKVEGRLRTRITASMVKRFSLMALPSVGVIGLTGIYSAILRVGSVPALLDTVYGNSLLLKQGFVAALLMIAAVNLLIISPGIHHDSLQSIPNSPFVQRFRKTVLAEVILACLLLGSVSLMTYLPPARTPLPKTSLTGTRKVDDLKIALSISPGLVGQNTYTVRLTPKRSAQAVKEVILTFVPVQANLPPSEFQLTAQGNGIYVGQGSNIGFPDRWLVEVATRREAKFDAIVSFGFNVLKPGTANENESPTILQISKALIILIGILIGVDLVSSGRASRSA